MGWFDYFSDLASAITIQDSAADAQQSRGSSDDAPTSGGASTKSPASGTDEESEEEAEVNKEDAKDDDGEEAQGQEPSGDDDEGGEEEEEEEEEEEDEPEDIKEKLEEECMKTAACAPLKHHYDECAERVQKQIDDNGKAEEDCVEEFFHMMHCASQCAAPKLFKALR